MKTAPALQILALLLLCACDGSGAPTTSENAQEKDEAKAELETCSAQDFSIIDVNDELMLGLAAETTHNRGIRLLLAGGIENNRKAFDCFEIAAEMEFPWSQYHLGEILLLGKPGIVVSYSRAYYWLSKAAHYDNPYAQKLLAAMYLDGKVSHLTVQNDRYFHSYFWAELARVNGDPQGEEIRNRAADNLSSYHLEHLQRTLTYWRPDRVSIVPHPSWER